jgi:hypothetical protein
MSTDAEKDSRTKDSDRTDSQANVLMPDIYADEPVSKKKEIELVELPAPDTDEPVGFNPYDTGTLHKK